jgi:hypothetical protein
MAAATMYADTSSPVASACALIALWIAGSVDIENRVFATPYGNTPCYVSLLLGWPVARPVSATVFGSAATA